MSGIASASRPGGRTLLCKQPARLLMIDLSPPFSTDVGHDVCEALENMFSLACNLSGPTRIPFFGVMALYNYPELLLPFSYVRNNFPRIQTAIYDIRNMIENLVQSDQSSSCIEQGLLEACSHYRCQLQSTLQTGGFGHQLEIVIVTCQSGTSTQKQVEATSLDLEQLKRIQIVCLSSLGSLMDNLSQASLSSDHSSTNSISGIVEIINQEPEYLCMQNFFNGWLLDTGTDSEHLHIILPPSQPGDAELTLLKCDLHETLLHPAQLPHHSCFTVHSDSATMKMVFPSTSQAMGMLIPIYKLHITNTIPTSALCDSIVYGMPMVVTETSCWKVDWDDLEKNQQLFKALCHTLLNKELAMIGYLESYAGTQKQTGTTDSGSAKPEGKFVLIPAQNGTLLIKSIAVQELMLPCQAGGSLEEPAEECVNIISGSLDQLENLENYNPLKETSHLYSCLKNSNKKATPRLQKRQYDTSRNSQRPCSSSISKISRRSTSPQQTRQFGTNLSTSRNVTYSNKRGGSVVNRRPTQQETNIQPYSDSFDDDDDGFDLGDNDENNNVIRYTSGHYSRRQPIHTFPTSL